jgi:hypothetical protein
MSVTIKKLTPPRFGCKISANQEVAGTPWVSSSNGIQMKKKAGMDDELRPEYDLSELLKEGVRGKYATRYREGTNLVLLAPDVAAVFPDHPHLL